MPPRTLLAVILLTAGAALAGCGSTSRPTSTSTSRSALASRAAVGSLTHPAVTPGASTASRLARAQRTHEYPGPAAGQRVVGGWPSAVEAVQVFATTYINWTAATVATRLRTLAQVSLGQARAALTLEATQAARDYELRRGGIANSGVVEAIAPVLDHPDQYAVATRELTTATRTGAYQGLAPGWHLALATVTRVTGGLWVLSDWQPEN